MEAVIRVLSIVAWPVTVVIIALLFRVELRGAVRRLTALSYKDVKAEFGHGLGEVEGQIRDLSARSEIQSVQGNVPEKTGSFSDYDQLLRIADISPRAAVMEAWREVEIGTEQVANAYGIPPAGRIVGLKAIEEMVDRGLLPPMLLSIYSRLRSLRSRAAHAPDFVIDQEQAERFIDTANHFYETFRFLVSQAEEQKRRKP